jgi:hypothetical protein
MGPEDIQEENGTLSAAIVADDVETSRSIEYDDGSDGGDYYVTDALVGGPDAPDAETDIGLANAVIDISEG